MFRHLPSAVALTALVLAGVLATSGKAAAQQGWQFYGGAGRPGYNAPAAAGYTYYGGYGSSEAAAPTFPEYAAPAAPAASYSYGALVSGAETAAYYNSTPAGRDAVIDVRVPANAVILFDGHKTTSTGPERRFVSPPLAADKEYVYEVTARWQEGGREVTRTRRLVVRAGQTAQTDFAAEAAR